MAPFSADKMCGSSDEMKEMAARICRDYLHGAWKHITTEEIGVKRISGGLSNWLYHVWLPETMICKDNGENSRQKRVRTNSYSCIENEPKEVLLRIYGQVHGDVALEHLITDSVIFTLLSERRLGPRLHGIFPGGRLEQFIKARPLLTCELAKPELSNQIARKMGIIHSMDVPISKEPNWIWKTSERWLSTIEKSIIEQDKKTPVDNPEQILKIRNYDLKNEMNWLRAYLSNLNSPVVFCHNDLQEGNILMMLDYDQSQVEDIENRDDRDDQLVLIDFEYCSYNYRGFDLANHFLEWTYDYTNPQHPYFYELPQNYPTKQQMLCFVNEYLKVSECGSQPNDVLTEIRAFSLASHFFWGLWACANNLHAQIPFGYWDYAVSRFDAYFRLKEDLTNSQIISVKRNLHDTD